MKPIETWSYGNKSRAHSSDARGYRQWQAVGRQVVKGAKARHIYIPLGEDVATHKMRYKSAPVFDISDTVPIADNN